MRRKTFLAGFLGEWTRDQAQDLPDVIADRVQAGESIDDRLVLVPDLII